MLMVALAPCEAYAPVHAPRSLATRSLVAATRLPLSPRMQAEEGEEEKPVAASSAEKSSPLAGIVSDQTVSEMQEYKDRENAKRLRVRKRNNILIPAVTVGLLLALQLAGGKAKLQELGFDENFDLLANTPGMAETRVKKAERAAQAEENRDAFVQSLRGN